MDNSFMQNFMAGAQLAMQQHQMQQAAEEHKLNVQKQKLALDEAKLQQALHQRDIQAMISGGAMTQPPPSVPDTTTPAPVSPDLPSNIADLLTQIRQQPVPAHNMPINPLPGPNIPVNLSTGMVTIPGTNREITQQEAARQAQAAITAKLAELGFGEANGTIFNKGTGQLAPQQPPPKLTVPSFIEEVKSVTPGFDAMAPADKLGAIAAYQKAKEKQAAGSVDQQELDAYLKANPGKTAFDYAIAKAAATRAPKDNSTAQENLNERSFQFNSTQLEKAGTPVSDAIQRFSRLQDTINQQTPQADALVAPELLTVMAGGQGSGLRMNEAEISRIVGGRTNLESIKAALNKWQLDPSKGLSITPAQRQQIQALVATVGTKLQAKQQIIDNARQGLVSATAPEQHRKIVADARTALSAVDSGSGPVTVSYGGKTYTFPSQEKADGFKKELGIK